MEADPDNFVTNETRESIAARFWPRVRISEPDECWPWLGPYNKQGYGTLWVAGAVRTAQRIAFFLTNADGGGNRKRNICHSCDNPPCCNPAHLWRGSAKDNAQDMVAKGRSTKGRPGSRRRERITAEQRLTDIPLTVQQVAERFGVANKTVRRWLAEGTLKGTRFGRRGQWRIPVAEVDGMLRDIYRNEDLP